jgi:hypothetical protein
MFGLLVACSQARSEYQTYVQANKSASGQTEVLVLVRDPATEKGKLDAATYHLLLQGGDTKSEVVGNKNFPGRRYAFNISLAPPILVVTVVISDNGHELYRSSQSFASWKGF